MRCLALAQTLETQHIDSIFLVREETLSICKSRHDWVGKVITVPTHVKSEQEVSWFSKLPEVVAAEVMVIDGYQFDSKYRHQLMLLNKLIVAFDDLNDIGNLYADVVINGGDESGTLDYSETAPGAFVCRGGKHRVFRREFHFLPPLEENCSETITLVFGGSDPYNLTQSMMLAINDISSEVPLRVITGASYPFLESLKHCIAKVDNPVQHIHDCQDIADAFVNSRLVVSAAGSSQFELLACAVPSVLITVAENQKIAALEAEKQGWCLVLENDNNVALQAASLALDLYHSDERLNLMRENALPCRDIAGGERVVNAIFDKLKAKRKC